MQLSVRKRASSTAQGGGSGGVKPTVAESLVVVTPGWQSELDEADREAVEAWFFFCPHLSFQLFSFYRSI